MINSNHNNGSDTETTTTTRPEGKLLNAYEIITGRLEEADILNYVKKYGCDK